MMIQIDPPNIHPLLDPYPVFRGQFPTRLFLPPPHWPGWIQLRAVCLLRTAAAEFVCGRLSERPARCDERHLDLPIHFTFAPINYSTGQPIKNEGERSGPRPPKAATRQLSPWIIGAINLALSNKGVLTLLSPSIALSLYTAEPLNSPVITDTHHNSAHTAALLIAEHWWTCITCRWGHSSHSILSKAIVYPSFKCNFQRVTALMWGSIFREWKVIK